MIELLWSGGGDLVADMRRIQSYGLQVQAGMIVGFDNGR